MPQPLAFIRDLLMIATLALCLYGGLTGDIHILFAGVICGLTLTGYLTLIGVCRLIKKETR